MVEMDSFRNVGLRISCSHVGCYCSVTAISATLSKDFAIYVASCERRQKNEEVSYPHSLKDENFSGSISFP